MYGKCTLWSWLRPFVVVLTKTFRLYYNIFSVFNVGMYNILISLLEATQRKNESENIFQFSQKPPSERTNSQRLRIFKSFLCFWCFELNKKLEKNYRREMCINNVGCFLSFLFSWYNYTEPLELVNCKVCARQMSALRLLFLRLYQMSTLCGVCKVLLGFVGLWGSWAVGWIIKDAETL